MIKKALLAMVVAMLAICTADAADFSKIPDPTKNVKVGQWVNYKVMGGGEQKTTVTAVEGSGDNMAITMKLEMKMGNVAMPAQVQKVVVREARAAQQGAWEAAPDTKITDTTVTVGGKEYKAVLVEAANQGMTSKIYMSNEVPVTGIIMMEVSGMPGPMMELDGFGG